MKPFNVKFHEIGDEMPYLVVATIVAAVLEVVHSYSHDDSHDDRQYDQTHDFPQSQFCASLCEYNIQYSGNNGT